MEDNYNKTYTLEELAPLGNYVVFPMIYENGVTYDDLVKEFSDDPRLFKLCRNLKVVKDKNFIIEVALKNNKAKVLSSIYQADTYLQYVVSFYENELYCDGIEAIKTYQDLKLNSYKGVNVGIGHIDYLNQEAAMVMKKWKDAFFKERTELGYIQESETKVLSFNYCNPEYYFGKKTLKFYEKLAKKIDYVAPEVVEYDIKQKVDLDKLNKLFEKMRRKEFQEKLLPIFEDEFNVKYSVETLEQLADEKVEDLCKKADEGKIKI